MHPTTLCDRSLIRVGGVEARAFLQGLLTQDVLSLMPGAPRYAGLLTPQGKALFDMMLWADPAGGEDVLIDCEASRAEMLVRRLSLYRLRRPVTIALEAGLAVHWSATEGEIADPRLPMLGFRWLGAATEGDAESDAGGDAGGDASGAYRAHRLAQGVPEGVAELGEDKTLWLECNAQELGGVDYAKGCYVGQENTARMRYRSKVNRRLVVLPIEQSNPARQRVAYPELGLAIDHRQVETLGDITLPGWLTDALAETTE